MASMMAICAIIPLGIGCVAKKSTPAQPTQTVAIQRGNLTISVPVDGNLVMPQAFDLRFGTPGDVRDVLVEEGDHVKAGAILAMLDNTTQRLDIQSANASLQRILSNLYQTVPRLPQFPNQLYDVNTVTTTTTTTVWDWREGYDSLGNPITDSPLPGGNQGYIGVPSTVTTTTTRTTIKAIPNTLHSDTSYPFYYPNHTALIAFAWAQEALSRADELFQSKNYADAESELYVAANDLETCAKIIEDTITNPQSGLGGSGPLPEQDDLTFLLQQNEPLSVSFILELQQLVELIKQCQADMEKVRSLTTEGKNDEAKSLFATIQGKMKDIGKSILNNVNLIEKRHVGMVYGKNICLYLYKAADDSLNEAFAAIEKGSIDSPEFKNNLRVAQHRMALCNAVLGSNDYVLQHGLSLKAEHQYKVDLQKSLVNLGNKQDDFLKTIILAPFDGTVVSVGVKKNDVLSAQDYSSKGTIQIVDTTAVKFEGLVDEIDILKVKTGQKATITVDAIPNKVFTGIVSFISPYGEAGTSNVVKFAVTIQLDPTDIELKGGLTATADIAIETVDNVVLVPLRAISSTAQGVFVTVIDETTGQTEKREVTLGRQNLQFAEVLSGLEEGERVVMEVKITGAPVVQGFPRPSGR